MSPTLNAEEENDECYHLKDRKFRRHNENATNCSPEIKKKLLPDLKLQNYSSLIEDYHCLFLDNGTLHMFPWYDKTIKKEWVFVNTWCMRKTKQQNNILAGDIGMFL